MEDIALKANKVREGIRAAQEIQNGYDEVGWRINNPPFRKLRHLSFHLARLTGLLQEKIELWEHQADESDFGDAAIDCGTESELITYVSQNLLYHALQLSSLVGSDAGLGFVHKIQSNARRFAPETEFAAIDSSFE